MKLKNSAKSCTVGVYILVALLVAEVGLLSFYVGLGLGLGLNNIQTAYFVDI